MEVNFSPLARALYNDGKESKLVKKYLNNETMDKHWKDVKVGDIILYKDIAYFKLCEGEFELNNYKFYGKHFKFVASPIEFFTKQFKHLNMGFECLEGEYKIIDKLPDNLYK